MLFGALSLVVTILVLYAVIRLAVRHGISDALRAEDERRTRAELGLGRPRSPNSGWRPAE